MILLEVRNFGMKRGGAVILSAECGLCLPAGRQGIRNENGS